MTGELAHTLMVAFAFVVLVLVFVTRSLE